MIGWNETSRTRTGSRCYFANLQTHCKEDVLLETIQGQGAAYSYTVGGCIVALVQDLLDG